MDIKIYTSYFAVLNKLPNGVVPISICGKVPEFYTGLQYKKLAPKYWFFAKWKENHNNEFYTKNYYTQVLDVLDPNAVVSELYNLAAENCGGKVSSICLICYKKPSDFCHRHLVAEWLNKNGIKCEEYNFNM